MVMGHSNRGGACTVSCHFSAPTPLSTHSNVNRSSDVIVFVVRSSTTDTVCGDADAPLIRLHSVTTPWPTVKGCSDALLPMQQLRSASEHQDQTVDAPLTPV